MPASLRDFHGRHAGASIVVCGCGESLNSLDAPERFITIGVNDVGRRFTPDYLVVVNPRAQFTPERFAQLAQTQASAVFTQLADLGFEHRAIVRFKLGRLGGTDFSDADTLHYTRNSPYVAVGLALQMGARRIGLIGVDFTDHHFFARTGPHGLARRLPQIDAEYARLAQACRERGVELLNLSAVSQLQSLPRELPAAFAAQSAARLMPTEGAATPAATPAATQAATQATAAPTSRAIAAATPLTAAGPKLFFVNYHFLSCGEVFATGLANAARQLGLPHAAAHWDDPALPAKLQAFQPDLLLAVHGRRFAPLWRRLRPSLPGTRSAVWLVDEPYEVDDTARWSSAFDAVGLNDPATLARHAHAFSLPVCHDPAVHFNPGGARRWPVGFIGGHNAQRERLLLALAEAGQLSYVVGGPWRSPLLQQLSLGATVPAERTAELYQQTQIVINVFRETHHFNAQRTPATTMNPRIHEALACGALVISEPREEISRRLPGLPTFDSPQALQALVAHFLAHPAQRQKLQAECAARLQGDHYAQRLHSVIEQLQSRSRQAAAGPAGPLPMPARPTAKQQPDASTRQPVACTSARPPAVLPFDADWDDLGGVAKVLPDGSWVIQPGPARGPAVERGLVGRHLHQNVALDFEVKLRPGARLLAKLHQQHRLDQASNSYHLMADGHSAYLARHDRVLRPLALPAGQWLRLRLAWADGVLSLHRDGELLHKVRDTLLRQGHLFLGAMGGEILLRGVSVATPAGQGHAEVALDGVITLQALQVVPPRVSIVTTVYDRLSCLRQCIASVRRLHFSDYEHLIVSDAPPPDVVARIADIVQAAGDPRLAYFNLPRRHNNWGIAPAAAGLRRARGEYLCFLSDDNGYQPGHLGMLVALLDRQPGLGFAYSSCHYAGRTVLRHPVPRAARIDLGQPMFRRELFERHFNDDLPFNEMAWDWRMIDALMQGGVRWQHVDQPSFIFRLAMYPQFAAA